MNKKQFKSVFADLLLPLGYIGVKDMFFRRVGDVFLIVDLQKSNFGGRYYVNIGLFVDDGANLTRPPPFHETHMIQRLESIAPQAVRNALVPALNLEEPMCAAERSAVITSALEQCGLPYLNSLSTIEGIADYLNPEKAKDLSPDRPKAALVTLELREIIKRRTGHEQSAYWVQLG